MAEPVFICGKCAAPTQLASNKPEETVCPACCEDHEYDRNTDAGWPTCIHCNEFAPEDYYEESGLSCGSEDVN